MIPDAGRWTEPTLDYLGGNEQEIEGEFLQTANRWSKLPELF
jgi:hypothetical protein